MFQTHSRRFVLASAGLGALAFAGVLPLAAQPKKGPSEVPLDELMKTGPLPDLALGKVDAPVTIIEYASMTCGHCAIFHNTVLPGLKEKYIDSGKVRLILREFPLDNLAAAGSMLARCSGPEKAYDVTAQLFKDQESWAFGSGNRVPALFKVAEASGFTKDTFEQCLKNEKMLGDITAVRDRANKSFGVSSTPTFFINGKRFDAASDKLENFEKAIDPLLKK